MARPSSVVWNRASSERVATGRGYDAGPGASNVCSVTDRGAIVPSVGTGMTRRGFLAGAAGAAALAATQGLRLPSAGAEPVPGPGGAPTVAVLGGGVAGLTAAHELAERGFAVTVYERRAWGGKARSMDVPGTGTGGRRPLPGEHGFRVIFGFEHNLPDTLRRIPKGGGSVHDHLVSAPELVVSRAGGRGDLALPLGGLALNRGTADMLVDLAYGAAQLQLPVDGVAHLARQLAIYLTSSDARRYGDWERTSWDEFSGASRYGTDYRQLLSEPWTHFLQAATADQTSTRFVGNVVEQLVWCLAGRTRDGDLVRVLDAPTDEAWIDPWLAHLTSLGVRLELGQAIERVEVQAGRVQGLHLSGPGGPRRVEADWYVCALPAERAGALWDADVLAADPALAGTARLPTGWMNGIKLFMEERTDVASGHLFYADSPWVLGSVSQAQMWEADFASTYGDGTAKESISVLISEWGVPGTKVRKPARECTIAELQQEIWFQLKRHLDDTPLRRPRLDERKVHSWFLDPGMTALAGGGFESGDPLILPAVRTWADRPESGTAIENLALAGDYVRGDWEVGNMEAANETGRRAANVVLERSGSGERRVPIVGLFRPPELEAAKQVDADRAARGLPHLLTL